MVMAKGLRLLVGSTFQVACVHVACMSIVIRKP